MTPGDCRIRRRALLAAAIAPLALPAAARAQASRFPDRPVRILQGYTPGGPADLTARTLADRLTLAWGQPVLVEARPGASGTLATGAIARAAPDGYTLVLAASTHAAAPSLLPRLPFDTLKDFTPVAQLVSHPLILVAHPRFRGQTLAELIAIARERPGEVTIGTAGIGTTFHLAAARLALRAGIEFTFVQYNGAASAHTAVLSGEVQTLFQNPLLAVPAVQDGRLRAIASGGLRRWRDLPNVPTIAESGFPDYEAGVWYGLLAPPNMPPELLDRIAGSVRLAMEAPELQTRLQTAGFETFFVGPAEFKALIEREHDLWAQVIRASGIRGVE
jgi:tripartite-type tricarboxylate transporter receptor subunit TctC